MPLIGDYGTGSVYSERYSTAGELLSQLPDNTANLIVAKDIRDAVYSLWAKVDDVQTVASQSASASSYYTNSTLVPVTIGGISAGMSFSATYSLQQMFDLLLYPYIAPSDSISPLSNRQYGGPLSVSLNWSVVRNTNVITSIIVDGVVQVPTGNSQSGIQASNGTHSTSPGVSQVNTFTMSVGDGVSTTISSTTLTWMNRRYWGSVDMTSIGNPNLTTNPGSASLVGSFITDTVIKALDGADANGQLFGNELSTTRSKTYNGIDGGGDYLVFAFPNSFGTPSFTVNSLPSTAFTKVRNNSVFSNEYSFAGTSYDVWVSNTLQGSPLNIVIS